MNTIKILSIETSTTNCSVALSIDGKNDVIKEENSMNYSHSEKLHVFINEVLQEMNLKVHDLHAIAISKGPGSYTGLRIGVSSAKGLCYACNLPIIGIPTLQSLAHQLKGKTSKEDLIIPMLDARRMEVYTQTFNSSILPKNPTAAKVLDEKSFMELQNYKLHFIGNGVAKFKTIYPLNNASFYPEALPSANEMSEIAFEKFNLGEFEDLAYFEPYYLKDFKAGKPKKRF